MDAEARQGHAVFAPKTLKAGGARKRRGRKNPPREGENPPVSSSTVQPLIQRTGDDSKDKPETDDLPRSREDDVPVPTPDKTTQPIQRPDDPGDELLPRNPGPERGEEP
jgi:hypothetical protein